MLPERAPGPGRPAADTTAGAEPEDAAGPEPQPRIAPAPPLRVREATPEEQRAQGGQRGHVVVDVAGAEPPDLSPCVGSTDMRGNYDWDDLHDIDETTYSMALDPGPYDVWWWDRRAGRRRGARVQVEAGKVVVLRARDRGYRRPPLRPGFGVLNVRAFGPAGRRFEHLQFRVRRWFNEEEFEIERGYASLDLMPGKYTVKRGFPEPSQS